MAARLQTADPAEVAAALSRVRAGEPERADLRLLTKHYLAVLEERAPGHSVEVRVPPYAAVQVIPGVRHTRGTPPAVVETDAATWIELASGALSWAEAQAGGRVRASGERADLTPYLPLAAGLPVLRPVTESDRDFLMGLYGSTREEELSQVVWPEGQREAFLTMQFAAQDAAYRAGSPEGSFDVVEVGGRPAGRLYVDRRPGEIRIVDVSLLPEFRGQGIGTRLIRQLIQEATASGSVLSLHVQLHNPAAELYRRLGFAVVADEGFYRRMEWSAK